MAGVRVGEQVVFLGLRESQVQLRHIAAAFAIGPEWTQAIDAGMITFLEAPPVNLNPDVVADRLLAAVDATQAQRVVVDSISELERSIARSLDPQRQEDYLAALLLAFRQRQVTALFLKETDKALAATLDFSTDALSLLAENVLLLQQVAYHGQAHRVLSVLKVRASDHDAAVREFIIRPPDGIQILVDGASQTGMVKDITSAPDPWAVAPLSSAEAAS